MIALPIAWGAVSLTAFAVLDEGPARGPAIATPATDAGPTLTPPAIDPATLAAQAR